MPKILIFSLAYHPFVGGAEVAIKEITDRLGGDFSFEMITCNLDGRQKAEEQMGNIHIHRIGKGKIGKYLFPWLAYKKAVELHSKNGYQIIWAMMANQAGLAALKFKRKYVKVKYLLTLQEGDSEWDIWLRTFLIRPIYKAIYRRADKIQAISRFLAQRAKKMGAKSEIEVVPNGINMEHEAWNMEQKQEGIKRVISVSRLVKKNGIEDLIRAVGLLVTGYQLPVTLEIIGSGKLLNRLKKITDKLKIQQQVNFRGEAPNSEVYDYLENSAVFVRPSLSEGLGNAFLEAMACGVPVLGTRVGGIPDFLEDSQTGYFCQVKNPQSIAEKIKYILDDKNREEVKQVTENARKLVEEKYSWSKIAIQMKNIFNSL